MLVAGWAGAEPLRIASFNTELSRRGPGLLLRDILKGEDAQVAAVVAVLTQTRPDIVLLQGIDHDANGAALGALAEALADAGLTYPHRFAARPNSGLRTGRDHDGDGRVNGPGDAQGYGRFPGQGGMAILSRHPVAGVEDLSGLLWRDLPGATLPRDGEGLFPDAALYDIQRLASVAFWDVAVEVSGRPLHLLCLHATPPVFDGAEDRNGWRNHDELRFWRLYLDGQIGALPPAAPVVLLGDANLDPARGEGRQGAIKALLTHPRLVDPTPRSEGAAEAGAPQDTVDWNEPTPGNLRVDYVLPGQGLTVTGAGVYWPGSREDGAQAAQAASRHRLVWVDLDW